MSPTILLQMNDMIFTQKRQFITDTIDLLIDKVKDDEYIVDKLIKSKDSLWHLTPEVVSNGWKNLNKVCAIYLPYSDKLPECNTIFLNRYNTYKNTFT
mgnify:CR=1 FL=1|tara:strand:+ start:2490 stop:2783 length:294 start_codon:yes stop_codon:yes gene_type:complete